MITKENNYKNNYEVHGTTNTVKVIVSGEHNAIYEVNSKIFDNNLENFLKENDEYRIMWLKTHCTQMNQILGKITNEATWIKAQVVEISYSMNYIELILRNGLFCVVQLQNKYEANIKIAELGGLNSIISIDKVAELLAKLSY